MATTEFSPLSLHDALPISLKDLVESSGLVFSGIATDMWDYPGHESHLVDANDGGAKYLATVKKNLEFTREDRKSTRLNSSHRCISYAVFCLKKKTNIKKTK